MSGGRKCCPEGGRGDLKEKIEQHGGKEEKQHCSGCLCPYFCVIPKTVSCSKSCQLLSDIFNDVTQGPMFVAGINIVCQ